MRRLLSLFGIVSILIIATSSHGFASAVPDRTQPTQGLDIVDNTDVARMPPAIFGTSNPEDQFSWQVCSTFTDSICGAASAITFFNHLPPCDSTLTKDCIKSVWATDSAGNKTYGKFVKYVDPDNPSHYDAIPEMGIPYGKGFGGIWDIPGVRNAAGNTSYLVNIRLTGWLAGTGPLSSRQMSWNGLTSAISPVKEVDDPQNDTHSIASSAGNGHGFGASGALSGLDGSCAGHEPKLCYAPADFPTGYRFGFSFSLSKSLQGWFHGRFFSPNIMIENKGEQTISVEAEPVVVPTLIVSTPTESLPKNVSDYIFSGKEFGMGGNTIVAEPSGQDAFDLASLFLPLAKDTATSSHNYWSFITLQWNQSSGNIQKCTASDGGVSGVVTTNALVYSAGPPSFNPTTSSLDYKLLSPHFQADGQPAVGTYDLLLRSSVARCVYKFTNAPVKASIEIVSNDGNQQIASSTLTEENGWLKMSAKGFSYSNPTIKVTLSQDKTPESVQNTTAPTNATKSVSKSETITCTKGKTVKKVSGIKPVCPKGFVKK